MMNKSKFDSIKRWRKTDLTFDNDFMGLAWDEKYPYGFSPCKTAREGLKERVSVVNKAITKCMRS